MDNTQKNIDSYIAGYPKDVQTVLKEIRATIREEAPESEEAIAYGMPAFRLNGKPLVYFAAYKKHIGFYATPSGHVKFEKEFSGYKQGKGSVQFPLDEAMPLDLIAKIIKFRVRENLARPAKKR